MLDILRVILLGIIEGVTEFLPISSTGHLIVAAALVDYRGVANSTFEIFIQFGAVVAVLVYYFSDIWEQVRKVQHDAPTQRFWLAIVIAFIPAGVAGFLFHDAIEAALFNPTTVALALIFGGVVLLAVERMRIPERATTHELGAISWRQALGIGVTQILALLPGMSRSGATIVAGMVAGLDRSVATTFSFYLALPTLGIATLYSLAKNLGDIHGGDWAQLIVGALVSGVVAWVSVRWLLNYVRGHSYTGFAIYRILAGVVILALVATHLL